VTAHDSLKDLELLVRSRYGIILLDTAEEERAEVLLRHLADRLGLPFFSWSRTKGLQRLDAQGPVYGTEKPIAALAHLESSRFPALYHFRNLGPDLEDAAVSGALRDVGETYSRQAGALVLTGHEVVLPGALRAQVATLRLPRPGRVEFLDLLQHILRDLRTRTAVQMELGPDDLNRLLNNLQGLTLLEAEKILTKAIVEDGRLSVDDIQEVMQAKKEIVAREGLLEYFPVEESMADIADLQGLKGWLDQRRGFLTDPRRAAGYGLSFPKGVLLLGVPGCGKSLCAKAVAMEWSLPLLKLDTSNLYNKYIGESERNFKRAIRTSERMAPVILWIDEMEKAFSSSGGDEDGGVSQRVLGTFLSWLQDRKGDVFVVATANDISRLPPEFLRKGRFDEIFFVDLPVDEARRAIFEIHLRKRGQDPDRFALPELVTASSGFSGSEIEQVIVAALYTAFARREDLSDALLHEELGRTRPLSQTMAEKVTALRAWARDRAVSAQ
jgi:SpoVK/Ycf46/Vps4 family AAA+-type ATPase